MAVPLVCATTSVRYLVLKGRNIGNINWKSLQYNQNISQYCN